MHAVVGNLSTFFVVYVDDVHDRYCSAVGTFSSVTEVKTMAVCGG